MSLLLSAGDLKQLRALGVSAMPDTAALTRATKGRSAAGGITNSWATIGTYACHIEAMTGQRARELITDGEFLTSQPWLVLLPNGTPAQLRDRLLINGHTYEVRGVGAGQSAWEVLVDVLCAEVQ